MKQLIQKLHSRRGESLVESLAAILIFTLASIVMYAMVTTAGDINMTAKEADRANQAQMVIAEQGEAPSGTGMVTMTITKADNSKVTVASVPVDIYGAEGDLFSYFKQISGGT